MRLHRLIYLLLAIEGKGKITAKELADQLEVSARTIYRDIDTLCEAGIPLITETGPCGGISLAAGYQTQIKHLPKEDIIHLYLNGIGVKAEPSSAMAVKSGNSLLKLQRLLSEHDAGEVNPIVSRFYVDPSPWWGEEQRIQQMDTIIASIWQSRKLHIHYNKINDDHSERTIRPYGLAVKERVWYIVAFCENSSALRIFKCERISNCRLLDSSFMIPDGFRLEEYVKGAVEDFHSMCRSLEQFPVTLQLACSDQHLLRGYQIYSSEEPNCLENNHPNDHLIEATVNMYSFEHAIDNCWNLLISSTVVSPRPLQEAVNEKLRSSLNRYSALANGNGTSSR